VRQQAGHHIIKLTIHKKKKKLLRLFHFFTKSLLDNSLFWNSLCQQRPWSSFVSLPTKEFPLFSLVDYAELHTDTQRQLLEVNLPLVFSLIFCHDVAPARTPGIVCDPVDPTLTRSLTRYTLRLRIFTSQKRILLCLIATHYPVHSCF
jgi:hypothetical protein